MVPGIQIIQLVGGGGGRRLMEREGIGGKDTGRECWKDGQGGKHRWEGYEARIGNQGTEDREERIGREALEGKHSTGRIGEDREGRKDK